MNLNELKSFKLADAVKFHSELNPKLWKNDQLDSLVKKQLLIIAEDFIEELGISGLDVVDVTVSGSNAAYSYTPHSDLDLHILVDMSKLPEDEVYRELFNAKKTIYNDSHDITVHGVPVELYVQDSTEPVVSLGEYSIVHDKWIKVPKRKRANFDQNATKAKYEQLARLIKLALKSNDVDKINKAIKTIKRYRKAGLDKGGEFGPENLAYKALRSQGAIQKLYDTRDKLHSEKLSIEEFGIDEDYDPNGPPPGPEFKPTMPKGTVRVDVSDVYDWYKLGQHISNMKGLGKHDFGKGPPSTVMSFGDEDLEHQYIKALAATGLGTTDIDPASHKKIKGQKTDPTYNVNEAPRTFAPQETPMQKLVKEYVFFTSLGNVHIDQRGETAEAKQQLLALVQRLQKDAKTFVGIDKNKMEANRDAILNHIHQMMQYAIPILKQYLPPDKWEAKRGQINSVLTAYNNARQINESVVYHVTPTRNLRSIMKNGLRPQIGDRSSQLDGEVEGIFLFPSLNDVEAAVSSWLGDEFDEDDDLSLLAVDITGLEDNIVQGADYETIVNTVISPDRIKVDDSLLLEASGYIPSAKEKNDPRFKTALTVDVKPDSIKKNAKAFNWKTSRAGIPPQANPSGKF